MNKKLLISWVFLLAIFSTNIPETAFAIPPPDFIIYVASSIGTFFAIGLAFSSAIFSIIYQFFKGYFAHHKKTFWLVSGVIIVSVSGIGALSGDQYYQQKEQEKFKERWLEETNMHRVPVSGDEAEMEPFFSFDLMKTIASAVRLRDSVVKTIAESKETANRMYLKNIEDSKQIEIIGDFFEINKNQDEKISNDELKSIIADKAKNDYVILDTRENLEYELGFVPGSIHVRLADLKAGGWVKLPTNKHIYVLCWSGLRGNEVVTFLKDKRLTARYLEKGLFDWVTSQGSWKGEVDFYKYYNAEKYSLVFTTNQVRQMLQEGVTLVDSRPAERYLEKQISGAISMPMLSTPSSKLENSYAQITKGAKVITICDDLVSCFDATATGIELERRGATFLGKYNEPWDF